MEELRMHHTRVLLVMTLVLAACGSDGSTTNDGGPTADGTPNQDVTQPPADAGDAASPADAAADSGAVVDVVRFVAMGDTGNGNTGQTDVAKAVEAKCAKDGCDFVQLLGDNIYDTGVTSAMDPQWQPKFEQPYANISLDFWAVLGNHDYGGNGAGTEFGKGQFEIDYTKVSQKWKLPSAYWHRTVKHVEFFGLDTNMQYFFQDAQQRKDVDAWVKASTSTWKIALGHHPYLSNGPHGNAGNYDGIPTIGSNNKSFMDSIVCGKVDFYICGHDHDRQWMKSTCQGTELIVSGAGSTTTAFKGSQPTWFQDDKKLGFFYVRLAGKTATVEVLDDKGAVELTRTITKP
jgi:hypothetical protein